MSHLGHTEFLARGLTLALQNQFDYRWCSEFFLADAGTGAGARKMGIKWELSKQNRKAVNANIESPQTSNEPEIEYFI